jgi:CRISPR-associated protein Csm5
MTQKYIAIKILTPLHIGDGNKIYPIEFFKYKGKTYFIDENIFFELMTIEERNDFLKFIKESKKVSLDEFLYGNYNSQKKPNWKLIERLKEKSYKEIESNIRGNIKTIIKIKKNPYIPGSEIKGAIRTAIIYNILKENKEIYENIEFEIINLKQKYKSLVEQVKNKKGNDGSVRKIKNTLVKSLSDVSKNIENLLRIRKDAKYDLLKNLIISDSNAEDTKIKIGEINTINTGRTMSEWIEYIDNGNFEFSININKLPHEKLIESINSNKLNKEFLTLDYIFKSIYEYSKDILEVEKEYFKNNNIIYSKLEKLEKENKLDSPLIRLGGYKGYLSNTVSLIVKNNNEELYDEFLVHCTKNTSYTFREVHKYFPKTRRILNDNIMGWCKLYYKR